MAKTNQNDIFYANNTHNIQFTLTDTDTGGLLDLTSSTVQWAMSRFADDGSFSTTPALKKDSANIGGITIDPDPTTGKIIVRVLPADTINLAGSFYQEVEVIDATGNPVVAATGKITLIKNVKNT